MELSGTYREPDGSGVAARVGFALTILAVISPVALADTSLNLGTSLPGWDKLRSGAIYDAGVDLGRNYSRQLSRFCSLPEVFLRDRSTSILSAKTFFEGYLPFGSREEVLLETSSQRVSLVHPRFGSSSLAVMFRIDGVGVGLTVCG